MLIKRKIIPIIYTNKYLYLTKALRFPYINSVFLKPTNYFNKDFFDLMLYSDPDNWYNYTNGFYKQYINKKIDPDSWLHFDKYDMFMFNCKITQHSKSELVEHVWVQNNHPFFIGLQQKV